MHGNPQILKLNKHELDLLESQFSIGGTECAEYIIKNLQISQSNNLVGSTSYYVDFDIDIRSLEQVFKLRRSEISMEYSTSLLGENVVSSNNITATLGGDFENYSLSLSDSAPNKVTVNIQKILGQIANDVNNFQSKIYHASIYIQNFDLSAILNLTVDENFDLKTFKEDGINEIEIECNQYNADINITIDQLLTINITDYNQSVYGGTKTLLTIEGDNLLPLGNESVEVWFTNAENADNFEWIKPYAGDYIFPQSSTKIEVYVPSYGLELDGTSNNQQYAGTGMFKLIHKDFNGAIVKESEPEDITVIYSVVNKYYQQGTGGGQTQPIMLTTGVTNNEYVIAYTPAFSDKKDQNNNYFKDAFQNALDEWCLSTNLNYIVDENAFQTGNYDLLVDYNIPQSADAIAFTILTNYIDENCSIEIDNNSPNHPETHEVDFIDNITITFNSSLDQLVWDAGSLIPTSGIYSVEQVSLHELGHAHGLRHTNNQGELMYYAANSSYSITNESVDASNYLQDHSSSQNCLNTTYAKRTSCTTGILEVEENLKISSRYSNNEIVISSNNLNLIDEIYIYSIDGKLLKVVSNNQYIEKRIPFDAEIGIYIITYSAKSKSIDSDKLLIMK